MNERGRWCDDDSNTSDELRELMRHARRQGPSERQVQALTATVLAQLPVAPPLAAHDGVGAAPVGGAATGLGLQLATLGLLVAAGVSWWWSSAPPSTPSRRAGEHEAAAARSPSMQPGPAERPPVSPDDPLPQPRASEQAATPATAGSTRRGPPMIEATLGELELLHAARLARREHSERALALLHQHEQRFPRSALREEREALLIELLRASDPAQAAARLQRFQRRYPESPYRERLKAR